jgi:hypothetical protein
VAVTEEYEQATAALAAAERAAAEALKEDVVESAEFVAAGKKPLAPEQRSERKALAAVEEAKHRVAVASAAGSVTQRQLERTICEARDAWLADLEAQEGEAADAFAAALSALREAAGKLTATRGGARWLENVNVSRREIPAGVATGKLSASIGGRNEYPLGDVLAALDTVANPPAPRQPRKHKVAAEASR